SYDPLSDTRAATSTTGGRLNFFKALNNPLLNAPALNGFPTVTVSPDVTASAGSNISLTTTSSDPDNDPLRGSWTRPPLYSAWLFGIRAMSLFPDPSSDPFSFPAPSLARDVALPYVAAVADGRGGSAQGSTLVTVFHNPAAGQPPSGPFSVT